MGGYIKTSSNSWTSVKTLYVKTSTNAWTSIKSAYVKTSSSTWQKWFSSQGSTPQIAQAVSISDFDNTSSLHQFTGTNYNWSPSPTTLTYYFDWSSDNINWSVMTSGSTTNPSTSNLIGPYTLTNNSNYWFNGGSASYRFRVVAQDSLGNSYTSTSSPYSFYVPDQPTVTLYSTSTSSVVFSVSQLTLDYLYTGRLIVFYYDLATSTYYYGVNGAGGYNPNSYIQYITISGLVPGRSYIIYVRPVTGTTGTNMSNYTGYAGTAAAIVVTTQSAPAPGAISVSKTDYSYLNSYSGFGGNVNGWYFYTNYPSQYYGTGVNLYSSNATNWTVYVYDGRGNYYATFTGTGNSFSAGTYWDDSVHGTIASYYVYASNSAGTASTYFQI